MSDLIDEAYIKLLQIELLKIFPTQPSQEEIFEKIGIKKNTFYKLFTHRKATEKTLEKVRKYFQVIDYQNFRSKQALIQKLKSALLGVWVSYRFSSKRRLHKSIWNFSLTIDPRSEIEKTDFAARYFIHASKLIKHESSIEELSGELIIDTNLTVKIDLKSEKGIKLSYYSVFFENSCNEDFLGQLKYLVFEATMLFGKKQYTQLEVLVKSEGDTSLEPKLIQGDKLSFVPNQLGMPSNDEYLAFNYLTRNSSRTRRFIDNNGINQKQKNETWLNYKHDIFISCPVQYLMNNKEEFDRIKDCIDRTKDVLIDTYKFKDELDEDNKYNIFCEMANYESFDELPIGGNRSNANVEKHITATHFIAFIPEALKDLNSGIYMEIYYRIQNKLPALVFVEKNRANLPSLLKEVLQDSEKPINIDLQDVDDLNIVSKTLEKPTKNGFPFDFTM